MYSLVKENFSYFKSSHWKKKTATHASATCFITQPLFMTNSPVQCLNFKIFVCVYAPVTASLKHSLCAHTHTWLVDSLTGLALTSLSSSKKPARIAQREEPTNNGLLLSLWLVSDWVGARRRAGRCIWLFCRRSFPPFSFLKCLLTVCLYFV